MARPLKPSTIRRQKPATVCHNEEVLPPVVPRQIVYLSVLPKRDIAGNEFDASPKVFATREAAQADCDELNKTRMHQKFEVREMEVH